MKQKTISYIGEGKGMFYNHSTNPKTDITALSSRTMLALPPRTISRNLITNSVFYKTNTLENSRRGRKRKNKKNFDSNI